jgi:hypothetical protein
LTNAKFKGIFKEMIASGDICPEQGDIDYKGLTSTNLFVVPKIEYWDTANKTFIAS